MLDTVRWNGEVMKNITKWMLAAAMAVGGLGLTAAPAKAAQIGVYIGAGPDYVPPCPGPGYVWIAGYYSNGYWVPGQWVFNGVVVNQGYYVNHFYGDRDDHDRGSFNRDDNHRDAGRNFDNRGSADRGRNQGQRGNRGR
jgi:hypothetical protein